MPLARDARAVPVGAGAAGEGVPLAGSGPALGHGALLVRPDELLPGAPRGGRSGSGRRIGRTKALDKHMPVFVTEMLERRETLRAIGVGPTEEYR